MAYLFQRDTYNGYKCACCLRHWDNDPEWFDTKEAALEAFGDPADYFENENGDADPYEITVTDGSTKEVVAHGEIDWPRGYGDKYQGEFSRRWHGHIEGVLFEQIFTRGHPEYEGLTWSELLQLLGDKQRETERTKANKARVEAQEKLAALEG